MQFYQFESTEVDQCVQLRYAVSKGYSKYLRCMTFPRLRFLDRCFIHFASFFQSTVDVALTFFTKTQRHGKTKMTTWMTITASKNVSTLTDFLWQRHKAVVVHFVSFVEHFLLGIFILINVSFISLYNIFTIFRLCLYLAHKLCRASWAQNIPSLSLVESNYVHLP